MDNLPQQDATKPNGILPFLKRNYLFLLAIGLVLFFFYIIYLSITGSSNPPQQTKKVTPTTTPVVSQTSIAPSEKIKKPLTTYRNEITWSPTRYSEVNFYGIPTTKTQLQDGSEKYTYASTDPKRPNEFIVKDDVITYHRSEITNKYTYHYTGTLGPPDYTFVGSKYYGPDSVTYVYLSRGTAFVVDAKTTYLHEQFVFQPTNLEDFKVKYGSDVSDFTVIPTLPKE